MASSSILGGGSFPNNSALSERRRVKMSGGYLAYATAADTDIGCLCNSVFTTDNTGSVENPNVGVSQLMVADGVISQFATVYAGAAGKVSASGSLALGMAMEAATADGDEIFVWRYYPAGSGSSDTSSGTTAQSFTLLSGGATAKLKLDTAAATGNFTLTVALPNLSGNITVTLPAVTCTLASLTGTETLTNKTFAASCVNSNLVTPVAAAGSAYTDAAAVGAYREVHITSDSAAKGVKLLTGVAGQIVFIHNDSSTAAKLYPAAGGTINGLTANAAVVIAASKGVLCLCTAADTWVVYDLPAHATTA